MDGDGWTNVTFIGTSGDIAIPVVPVFVGCFGSVGSIRVWRIPSTNRHHVKGIQSHLVNRAHDIGYAVHIRAPGDSRQTSGAIERKVDGEPHNHVDALFNCVYDLLVALVPARIAHY